LGQANPVLSNKHLLNTAERLGRAPAEIELAWQQRSNDCTCRPGVPAWWLGAVAYRDANM